jgi:hypothetical protein
VVTPSPINYGKSTRLNITQIEHENLYNISKVSRLKREKAMLSKEEQFVKEKTEQINL